MDHERFGIYPNGLGYDDQDPLLILDFQALSTRRAYWWDKVKAEADDTKAMDDLIGTTGGGRMNLFGR